MNCTHSAKFLIVFILVACAVCSAAAQDSANNGVTPMTPASGASSNWRGQFTGPSAPANPGAPSRPSTWPTDPSPDQRTGSSGRDKGLPAGELHVCEGAVKLGGVGQEIILASEIMPSVNEFCMRNQGRIPSAEIEAQRKQLIQQGLQRRIETLLITQDAKRTIPSEGWTHVHEQLGKMFEEQELDKMIKQSGANSRTELDAKLKMVGSSVEKMKRAYCEHELARQWVGMQIKVNEEVTYDQMLTYYRKHTDDFTKPSRAKWEELMIGFARYPTKEAAGEAIARLGNQVVAGAPFAEVAKASDGVTASKGGRRDWTAQGSLVCQAIDQALFTLPVGQLSPIIEGPTGFHIVRVTQREEVMVTPFLEAQVEIRTKIMEERRKKQITEYLDKLKGRTAVWTIFDKEKPEQQTAAKSIYDERLR
ncbi:MAG: peptidyl-prolyl cis-trans isomerase [Thermoguttaceae bacterium]